MEPSCSVLLTRRIRMFAADQTPVAVGGVAIGIVAWAAKHRHRCIGLVKAHHPVVGNIRPDEIATGGKICRTFGPAAPAGELFEIGMTDHETQKFGIVDDIGQHSSSNQSQVLKMPAWCCWPAPGRLRILRARPYLNVTIKGNVPCSPRWGRRQRKTADSNEYPLRRPLGPAR